MSVNKSAIWGNPNQIQLFNWGWGCWGKATRWVIPLFNAWEFAHPTIGLTARLIKGDWQKSTALLKPQARLEIRCIQLRGSRLLGEVAHSQLPFWNFCQCQTAPCLDKAVFTFCSPQRKHNLERKWCSTLTGHVTCLCRVGPRLIKVPADSENFVSFFFFLNSYLFFYVFPSPCSLMELL